MEGTSMKNILFVCTGNTCRSPMAEALLKHKSKDIQVKSAGLFAGKGAPASTQTREVLSENGINLNHQSQPLTPQLVEWADLILTMTSNHKQSIIMQYSEAEDKVFTLKEYVDENQLEIWRELKEAYATLESNRAILKTSDDKDLSRKNEETRKKIDALEKQVESLDIQDPFGEDVNVYRKTLEELEKYIELLWEKVDNRDK